MRRQPTPQREARSRRFCRGVAWSALRRFDGGRVAHQSAFDGDPRSLHDEYHPEERRELTECRWSGRLRAAMSRAGTMQRDPRGRGAAVYVLEDCERRAVEEVVDVVRWPERHADDGGNRSHRDPWEPIVGNA